MRSFDDYKKIFESAVVNYATETFFANLIVSKGSPEWPGALKHCAIIGIRHEGPEVGFRENIADDLIVMCRIDSDGNPMVKEYEGTTESGFFKDVVNPKGDFKMSPGFYFFRRGLHHGKYPCLVQAGPVIGQRALKNHPFDGEYIISDGSLHCHAGILNRENVGNWSAGCVVISGGWEGAAWISFKKYIDMSAQEIFPFVLVNESDIPDLLS